MLFKLDDFDFIFTHLTDRPNYERPHKTNNKVNNKYIFIHEVNIR